MISAIGAVLILGILIFVHELGHFLAAKWRGVGVIEFALGFGKVLIKKHFGGTDYTLRLIPLGGFVRMAGDDPNTVFGDPEHPARAESLLTGADENAADEKQRFSDPSSWFLKKSLWSRSAIIIAGPLFNLIFAWILAVGAYSFYGKVKDLDIPVLGAVFPGYPAEAAGLQEGDKILEIDGRAISTWTDLAQTIRDSAGKPLLLKVERSKGQEPGLKEITLTGTEDTADMDLLVEEAPQDSSGAEPKKVFKVGIVPELGREPASFREALTQGTQQVYYLCSLTFRIFGALIEGVVAPSKVLGGPIAVISGAAKSADRGLESSIEFMVLLSVSLCIFNLLPIPILDGGHLLFIAIEVMMRRPLNLKFIAVANNIGMAMLLSLMLFALSNDLMRLF
jgi:regulator of sigma E protease